MINRSVPEMEYKLMILYALVRLGPCTADQLLQFMAEYELVDYFTMQLSISDMEEQGQVALKAHPFGDLLTITDSGVYTVEEFDRRIPASFRDVIDRECAAWHERFCQERQTPARLLDTETGKAVHLVLMQGELMVMEVRMPVPSGDEATVYLQKRWRETALDAQQLVHHLLMLDCPSGAVPPLPDSVELRYVGHGVLQLTMYADPNASLMLAVSDERTARWYAHRWQLYGRDVLQAVLNVLQLSLLQEE